MQARRPPLTVLVCTAGVGIRIGVMHLLMVYAGWDEKPLIWLTSLLGIVAAVVVAAVVLGVVVWSTVRSSLPTTEGEATLPGLSADVTVLRDGRRVTTERVDGLDHDGLIELMIAFPWL